MTTWTPASKQSETWTANVRGTRAFDPAGFDNSPRFDTGQAGGYWPPKTKQDEVWTAR